MQNVMQIKFIRKEKQIGLSLLEVLLVLAIGSAIIVMGFRQVQTFQNQRDMQLILLNVDTVFKAMGDFYQGNCSETRTLDPAVTPGTTYVPDLTNYLSGTLRPIPNVVGYSYQFYRPTNTAFNTTNVHACWNFTGLECSAPQPILANQILWTAIVAVEIGGTANVTTYKNLLDPDCVSDSLTNCPGSGTGNFLIWERLPSFASPNMTSDMWPLDPITKQFKLQYTHDQMYELTNPTYADTQNYLCGG